LFHDEMTLWLKKWCLIDVVAVDLNNFFVWPLVELPSLKIKKFLSLFGSLAQNFISFN